MGHALDRVLVLEDDPISRRLAVILLQGMGAQQVLEAADGHAAAGLLDHTAGCDLALCDLNMTGMDGVEFLRRLGEFILIVLILMIYYFVSIFKDIQLNLQLYFFYI